MNEILHRNLSFETLTCLIVDDDKFSRTFAKTALYQIGIKQIKEAASVQEAIDMLNEYKINFILLDHQIPEKAGLEFAKELKNGQYGSNKNIPLIMVTIDTKEQTVLLAKELGIQEYLVKPISPVALKKRICSAVGIKQERI